MIHTYEAHGDELLRSGGADDALRGSAGDRISSMGNLSSELAGWPNIDRYPIIIGSNITLTYAASAMRNALQGYRAVFVDLLDELLDHEPGAMSVMSKRILSVAGGRMEVIAATPPPGGGGKRKAEKIRAFIERQIFGLKNRTESIASLLWATWSGLQGSEILYKRTEGWEATELQFIHSRRLAYPDWTNWKVHVWDQGALLPTSPLTGGSVGLCVDDYPGKFIIHKPQLRANYPTREGLGRILVTYMLFKRLALRASAQDFERFVKPWVVAYLSTAAGGKPRAANDLDKVAANNAIKALGVGSLASVVLPDSVRLELLRAATNLDLDKFLEYLDGGINKLIVGQTYTTQPGKFGAKGNAQTGKQESIELGRYDATNLCDAFREQLVKPLVARNFPGCEELTPFLLIHVDEPPDPGSVMGVATQGALIGMPIDADALADQVGLPLVPNKGKEPRVLKPTSPTPPEGLEAPVDENGKPADDKPKDGEEPNEDDDPNEDDEE